MKQILIAFVMACALSCGAAEERGTFVGIASTGFEWSTFRPCGTSEEKGWWFDLDPGYAGKVPGFAMLETEMDKQQTCMLHGWCATSVYVEVDAILFKEGGYGHLNSYSHMLRPERITKVAAAPPASCR